MLLKKSKDQKNKQTNDTQTIAVMSLLVEKIKDGKLLLIDKLINVRNSIVSGLLVHTPDEDKQIVYAMEIGFCCHH